MSESAEPSPDGAGSEPMDVAPRGATGSELTPAVPPRLPAHAPLDGADSVACHCASCGRSWSVHRDLGGYRVRCECGAFITVSAALATGRESALDALVHGGEPDLTAPRREGLFAPPTAPREVHLDSALEQGALAEARNEVVQRWTSRTLFELALLMAAFLLPQLVVQIFTRHSALFMPLGSLVSSVCMVAVGLLAPGYTFGSLKLPKARFFLEAALGWVGALLFAFAWMYVLHRLMPDTAKDSMYADLRNEIGTAMALFVMALCPGIFEELAFRGLVQGRLGALFGTQTALVITGVAFACGHGISNGFPIHLALGLYLCWLRVRAGSLIPGMLVHACYNATIVLLA